MKFDRSSAAYGAAVLTIVNLVSQFIAFAYRIVLSRMAGAAALGLYSLIMPFYAVIMALCVTGLTVAVSRLSAEYTALSDFSAVKRLIRTCMALFLIIFIPISVAAIIFSDPISAEILGDARTQAGIVLLIPCILLTGIENIHKNYFYGVKNITPPAISEISEQIIRSAAVLILLYLVKTDVEEYTVALIVCGMVICEVFSCSILRFLYVRSMKQRKKMTAMLPKSSYPDMMKKIFTIAAPVALTSLLGNILSSVNAIMIPQRLSVSGLTHEEALSSFGVLFGMSLQLLNLPMAFVGALGLIMVPRLAENRTLGNLRAARAQVQKTLNATGALVLSSVAVLIPLGPGLASFLFDRPDAGAHFTVLSLGTAVGGYQIITGSMLNGLGYQKNTMINFFIGAILSLGATYYLTALPEVRTAGYAWASLGGSTVTAALNVVKLHRAIDLPIALYRWLFVPSLAALAGSLWANYFFRILTPAMGAGLAGTIAAVSCISICLAVMRVLGVIPAGAKRLKSLFS